MHVQRLGTIDEAERAFNQAISQAWANLSEELTTNIEGVRRQAPRRDSPNTDEVWQLRFVSLIVATTYPEFTEYRTPEHAAEALTDSDEFWAEAEDAPLNYA